MDLRIFRMEGGGGSGMISSDPKTMGHTPWIGKPYFPRKKFFNSYFFTAELNNINRNMYFIGRTTTREWDLPISKK